MGSGQEVGAALRGAVELGNDDMLQPPASARWSIILKWVVGVLPWEVGAAGCFATTVGNDDSW